MTPAAKAKDATLRIKQVRSAIGASPKQAATLKALRLGRIGAVTERPLTVQLQGQIRVITHLVDTEEAA